MTAYASRADARMCMEVVAHVCVCLAVAVARRHYGERHPAQLPVLLDYVDALGAAAAVAAAAGGSVRGGGGGSSGAAKGEGLGDAAAVAAARAKAATELLEVVQVRGCVCVWGGGIHGTMPCKKEAHGLVRARRRPAGISGSRCDTHRLAPLCPMTHVYTCLPFAFITALQPTTWHLIISSSPNLPRTGHL